MKSKMVRVGYGVFVETKKGIVLQETCFYKTKKDVRAWIRETCAGLGYEIVPLYALKSDLKPKGK